MDTNSVAVPMGILLPRWRMAPTWTMPVSRQQPSPPPTDDTCVSRLLPKPAIVGLGPRLQRSMCTPQLRQHLPALPEKASGYIQSTFLWSQCQWPMNGAQEAFLLGHHIIQVLLEGLVVRRQLPLHTTLVRRPLLRPSLPIHSTTCFAKDCLQISMGGLLLQAEIRPRQPVFTTMLQILGLRAR